MLYEIPTIEDITLNDALAESKDANVQLPWDEM